MINIFDLDKYIIILDILFKAIENNISQTYMNKIIYDTNKNE